jgi:hypothetical protein
MHTQCDNCNAEWIENAKFCYQCGQDHHRMPINFKHFMLEFLESTLHFETKNFRMVKLLFTNPGLIIKEFNENKRARFVNPLRLYIFLGFIFFMSTHIHHKESKGIKIAIQGSSKELKNEMSKTLEKDSILAPLFADYKGQLSFKTIDSISKIHNIDLSWEKKIDIKISKNLSKSKDLDESFMDHFLKYIYNSLLILIPLFAFVTLLLIGYKKHFYQSTLNYALYFHCLLYIILSLKNVISIIFPNVFYIAIFMILFYQIYSLKVAFSLSWKRSVFNSIILGISYIIMLSIASFCVILYILLNGNF